MLVIFLLASLTNDVHRSSNGSSSVLGAGGGEYQTLINIFSIASVMCSEILFDSPGVKAVILPTRRRYSDPLRGQRIENGLFCLVAADRLDFIDLLCWRQMCVVRPCIVFEKNEQHSYEQRNKFISRGWNKGSWFQNQQPSNRFFVSNASCFLLEYKHGDFLRTPK